MPQAAAGGPGRTYRFCFTNRQIATAITRFLWSRPELPSYANPAYLVQWTDDLYSRDLSVGYNRVLDRRGLEDLVWPWGFTSGTVALGGSTGNTALDAINGVTSLANSLYSILSGCGCAPSLSPNAATPEAVVTAASTTANAVTSNPLAAGLIAMGQTGGSTGNVALDAINGTQSFANALYGILSFCGCIKTAARDLCSSRSRQTCSPKTRPSR